MGLSVRVATSAYYVLSVVVGHFAVSGVGIWTDRQVQEGGLTVRRAQRRGAVGVGRVAIFNALKGMPPPSLPPTLRASALTRAPDEIQINPSESANASPFH